MSLVFSRRILSTPRAERLVCSGPKTNPQSFGTPATTQRINVWEMTHHLLRVYFHDKGWRCSDRQLLRSSVGTPLWLAISLISCFISVKRRSAHRRRFRITPSCKAGPKLLAWRATAQRAAGSNANVQSGVTHGHH